MIKRLFLIVVTLVAVGFGAWWFWSLGTAELPEEDARITLGVAREPVEVRRAGGTWETAEDGMTLNPGDEVRTGSSGRATIFFFGSAESSLREETTVTIQNAAPDGTGTTDLVLQTGRIWSRVLQLFELGDAFTVRTTDVVATVRGTSFDVRHEDGETELWVAESRVEVAAAGEDEGTIVTAGRKLRRTARGTWTDSEDIGDEESGSEWFVRNRREDGAFQERLKARASARLQGGGRRAPLSFDGAVGLSESLHLRLAKAERPRLYAAFVGRKLAGIISSVEEGKSGLALQELARLEKDLRATLKRDDAPLYRQAIFAALNDAQILIGDAGPGDERFRLKQKIEDLHVELAGTDEERRFMHHRAIENRIKETVALLRAGTLEEASVSLTAAEQGLLNARREIGSGTVLTPTARRALSAQLRALDAHAAALRTEIDSRVGENRAESVDTEGAAATRTDAPHVSATGTVPEDLAPVESADTLPVMTEPLQEPVPEPVSILLIRIIPLDGKTELAPGESLPLLVTAIYSNGTSKNVTPSVIWTSSNPQAGRMDASVFTTTANSFGTTTVTASYTEGDQTVGEAVTISVAPATLR